MKKCFQGLLLVAVVATGFFVSTPLSGYTPPSSNHADYNFNYDWLFLKSNPSGTPSSVSYSETSFIPVSLPHTWSDDRFREWVFDSNATAADPLRPGAELDRLVDACLRGFLQ